jgi:hypothetical protein
VSDVEVVEEGDVGWRVFPNPATDVIHVQALSDAGAATGQLLLFNALGQVAASALWSGGKGEIPVAGLPAGWYCAVVCDPQGRVLHRQSVVVQ